MNSPPFRVTLLDVGCQYKANLLLPHIILTARHCDGNGQLELGRCRRVGLTQTSVVPKRHGWSVSKYFRPVLVIYHKMMTPHSSEEA